MELAWARIANSAGLRAPSAKCLTCNLAQTAWKDKECHDWYTRYSLLICWHKRWGMLGGRLSDIKPAGFRLSQVLFLSQQLKPTSALHSAHKMSIHITVLPASTQAGRETIRALLADDSRPTIQGIYRNTSKTPPEFANNPRFTAVQGDVSDGSSLNFSGSDAVFYIPPPTFDGTDSTVFGTNAANDVKEAVQKAPSVKRLLLFSAIGAQHEKGIVRVQSR